MSSLVRLAHRPSVQFLSALIIYSIATTAITLPFVPRLDQTLYNWGDALLATWGLGWNMQTFLLDPLSLYQAPPFYPYPLTLAFTETMIPQSALALPVFLITDNYQLAHNLSIVVAYIMNGLAMYLLLRWWKLGYWGALVGGFIYAFGHFHLIHFQHLQLLSSQWLPLVLLFFDLALERKQPRFFLLLGLTFVFSALSSFYYAFFTSLAVLCYGAVRAWQLRADFQLRRWLALAATFALSGLVLLPFGLPYIALARDFGLSHTVETLRAYAATPLSYLAVTSVREPFASLRPLIPVPHSEAVISPGLVALVLGLYGLVRGRVWRPTSALVLIGIVGFVLSLGPDLKLGDYTLPMPNRLLYDYVPGFAGAMRAISRWGLLVLFAVAGTRGLCSG